jgi:hypothetical protein
MLLGIPSKNSKWHHTRITFARFSLSFSILSSGYPDFCLFLLKMHFSASFSIYIRRCTLQPQSSLEVERKEGKMASQEPGLTDIMTLFRMLHGVQELLFKVMCSIEVFLIGFIKLVFSHTCRAVNKVLYKKLIIKIQARSSMCDLHKWAELCVEAKGGLFFVKHFL